jgi:SagB-type dehydrogenase family enzyme
MKIPENLVSTMPLDLHTDMVDLPAPDFALNGSLEQALKGRRSSRAFLSDPLSVQTLSTLLWAGFGINRRDSGGRTAPSAHNWQEIDIFAVLPEGAYRYDATAHRLMLVKAEDLRNATGMQDFVATAPLNLVYVADVARMHDVQPGEVGFLAGAAAGCIAQNVYLYCATAGLATVVRGLIDRQRLANALGLSTTERITLAQTVGRPVAA